MQVAKRIYLVLALVTLSSNLITVVGSTVAAERLAHGDAADLIMAPSLSEFLVENYLLETVTCRLCFYLGIAGFVCTIGARAILLVKCPPFARISLLIQLTVVMFMLGMIQDGSLASGLGEHLPLITLPVLFVQVVAGKAITCLQSGNPFYAVALALGLVTIIYIAWGVHHVVQYFENLKRSNAFKEGKKHL